MFHPYYLIFNSAEDHADIFPEGFNKLKLEQQISALKTYEEYFSKNEIAKKVYIQAAINLIGLGLDLYYTKGANKGTSKTVFPEDPKTFNPDGLVRKEYNNGKIIKWHDPKTGKAVYEWNADPKYGNHYHVTPDGKNRIPHPDTGDTHIRPGESVPKINK